MSSLNTIKKKKKKYRFWHVYDKDDWKSNQAVIMSQLLERDASQFYFPLQKRKERVTFACQVNTLIQWVDALRHVFFFKKGIMNIHARQLLLNERLYRINICWWVGVFVKKKHQDNLIFKFDNFFNFYSRKK
jgi:hypothetical protein